MKILFVASECAPFAKVGGLADVVGALPKFLKIAGVEVSVVIPYYEFLKFEKQELKIVGKNILVSFKGKDDAFDLWETCLPESQVPLYLISHPQYFAGKNVYVEADASSGGSMLEATRFIFMSVAAIKVAEIIKADILHCHDWHAAIVPFLIKRENNGGKKIKTLLTIHNLCYQGVYPENIVNELLATDFKLIVNCLTLGILGADHINTVSPSYAAEILTPEYGAGVEKYLEERTGRLSGILNGVDPEQFNPEKDQFIFKQYSAKNLENKYANKNELQHQCFGESNPDIPLLGIVTRLADQKGIYLIQETFRRLMEKNLQFILLGEGLPVYKDYFLSQAEKYPEKFWCKIAFDEELAHRIYAGADIFLMPSLFEPCGFGQQIAMKYGTVSVARDTGGIKDTVVPVKKIESGTQGTGFLFKKYRAEDFLNSIEEALDAYNKQKNIWREIQLNGMNRDSSWQKPAAEYKSLYEKILAGN